MSREQGAPTEAEGTQGPSPTAERILDAATRVFAEQGIGGTGMRGLADAAGVSVPTLYNHFESKGALVKALFDREGIVLGVLSDLPVLPGPMAERLDAVVRAQFDFMTDHFELVRLINREAANATAEALDLQAGFVASWIDTWRETIAGASDLRPGVDLDAAAEAVKCCVWGIFSVYLTVEPGSFDAEASMRAMVTTMAAALT